MHSWLTLTLALAVGCGTDPDTRPETAAYVSEAILVPYCGRAACHSSTTQANNYVFDNVDTSIASMAHQDLVTAGNAQQSELYRVISGNGKVMPPDQPLPDADIALIEAWITGGAEGLQ